MIRTPDDPTTIGNVTCMSLLYRTCKLAISSLKFTDFYAQYRHIPFRNSVLRENQWNERHLPDLNFAIVIQKRSGAPIVTRLQWASPKHGEIFYLRIEPDEC